MTYVYYYVRHEDEYAVWQLEAERLFGVTPVKPYVTTDRKLPPSRSPFMKGRIACWVTATTERELMERMAAYRLSTQETYKLTCVNDVDFDEEKKWSHSERRRIEREVGSVMNGTIDLTAPTMELGLLYIDGTYYVGPLERSEAVWFHHQRKPRMYSTALSTRLARALVNIAVPNIDSSLRIIDPCCGIGTVLVEALSMGISIVGSDINPLVCDGSRENIAHFGYEGDVRLQSIHDIEETYDVAIIDLPYNLFTHITDEQLTAILTSAYTLAQRVVFVAIEPIEEQLRSIGFRIDHRAVAKKGKFERTILVCSNPSAVTIA